MIRVHVKMDKADTLMAWATFSLEELQEAWDCANRLAREIPYAITLTDPRQPVVNVWDESQGWVICELPAADRLYNL